MSMNGSPSGEARGTSPQRRASSERPLRGTGLRALLVVVACVVLLGACTIERKLGIVLINDLGETVEIVYALDPEVVAGRLGTEERDDTDAFDFGLKPDPGAPPGANTCTTADIVARALDGRVLARIPPPKCWDGTSMLLSSFPGP